MFLKLRELFHGEDLTFLTGIRHLKFRGVHGAAPFLIEIIKKNLMTYHHVHLLICEIFSLHHETVRILLSYLENFLCM